MRFLDLTLPTPTQNLALDEALLQEAAQRDAGETLRFWMSPQPVVVIGIGAKIREEANLESCEQRQVPVLRRCSGGGTVIQGPGCLSYALILRIPHEGPLTTIQGANRFIMERHADVLTRLLGKEITVQGHTDLATNLKKVSGNAQRRLRRHLLFHGTFLLEADLPLISELLPTPALQPAYRNQRLHADFLSNLFVSATRLKQALQQAWGALEASGDVPHERLALLLNTRYEHREWNFRR
jgi:lipoate-protein ligase A